MAKDKLTDYDSTASGNLDVGGISVAEGMLPSNVNNAIREQMSHLKDFADGTEAINALAVDNLRMDGNTISSTDTNGDITLAPDGTGVVALSSTDLTFGDNDKAIFGAGSDLQIYHTGGSSVIKDAGTGTLWIGGSSEIALGDPDITEYFVRCYDDGAVTLYYDNAAKLATTSTGVDITGTVTADGVESTCAAGDANQALLAYHPTSTSARTIAKFQSNVGGTQQDKVVIKCDGSVGIGTASPDETVQVFQTAGSGNNYNEGTLKVGGSTTALGFQFGYHSISSGRNVITSLNNAGGENQKISIGFGAVDSNGEPANNVMTLTQSGNVLIGKTTLDYEGTAGLILRGDGFINLARSNGNVTDFNRLDSDGDVVRISQDGTTIGNITVLGSALVFGAGNTGLKYGSDIVSPSRADNGNDRDNVIDLGKSASRFNDAFITNGVTTGSDANEKQQIALLTDAEIRAAKSISAGFKTFKWNDAVEAKGDNARTHTGVIAQEVQAALEAEGLDAGNYAFWMSDTWWETQTEVPAVEAVEAVDAVYEDVVIPAVEEELDEDGNVIVEAQAERTEQRLVSEAIVPVEAVDAYTRTDTYDTAEEAPEGAVERTRMGIRYPELLAFVGAATEQRLANIETRLAALEA